MNKNLAIVLGMTIAYVASLAGMFIAMWAYKKRARPANNSSEPRDATPGGGKPPC